jgi:hypothetical protein
MGFMTAGDAMLIGYARVSTDDPLQTTYPDIARSMRDVLTQLPPSRDEPELVVDATGVGVSVVDGLGDLGLRPTCVTIIGGFAASGIRRDMRVAKKLLASTQDIVLSEKRLKVSPDEPLAKMLTDELADFTIKVTTAGNETFAAGRESAHDDLVLSVALAVYAGEKKTARSGMIPFNYMAAFGL